MNCDSHWNVTNKKSSLNHNSTRNLKDNNLKDNSPQLKNRFDRLESDEDGFDTLNKIHYNDDSDVTQTKIQSKTIEDITNSKFRKRPVCVINEHHTSYK